MTLWETFTSLEAAKDRLKSRRYCIIECFSGKISRIILRPHPCLVTWWHAKFWGPIVHRWKEGDRCWVYCDQPYSAPVYLALRYVQSTRGTTFATLRAAALAVDELANIKGVDAILCDACNLRISDRLLKRWGWTPHALSPWSRNHIKRLQQPSGSWTVS